MNTAPEPHVPATLPPTVVVGATGHLGSAFLASYRKIHPTCIGLARVPSDSRMPPLDLRRPDLGGLRLQAQGYRDALILAGVTGLERCEKNPAGTRAVNVTGTLELIRQLAAEGLKPIFASSDQVFDGKTGTYDETAPIAPTTEYGRQKAEVEARIGEHTRGNHLVIRIGTEFSLNRGSRALLDELADRLREGGPAFPGYDDAFSPVLLSDLISVVARLQVCHTTGLIHVASPEVWSRRGIAAALAEALGLPGHRVAQALGGSERSQARPPCDRSLDTSRLREEIEYSFVPLRSCIDFVARQRKGAGP